MEGLAGSDGAMRTFQLVLPKVRQYYIINVYITS